MKKGWCASDMLNLNASILFLKWTKKSFKWSFSSQTKSLYDSSQPSSIYYLPYTVQNPIYGHYAQITAFNTIYSHSCNIWLSTSLSLYDFCNNKVKEMAKLWFLIERFIIILFYIRSTVILNNTVPFLQFVWNGCWPDGCIS